MRNLHQGLTPLFAAVAVFLIFFNVTGKADAALSASASSLNMTVGSSQTLTITGGTGFYKIISSAPAIATASIGGSAADELTIVAVALGTATITIEDSTGGTTTVDVAVSQITLSKSAVSLVPGAADTVTILTGSTYYNVVSSDDSVATASVYNDTVTITGVASGTATVTVTDSNSDIATISVTVGSSFTVSPASMTLSIGESGTATISDASGFYNASSSDTAVATAVLNGTTVTVKAVAAGSATITITNSAGFSDTLTVTVDVSLYATVTLGNSGSQVVSLAGGSGFYNVAIGDDTIVSVTLIGDQATFTGVSAGKTTVTITDNQSNKVVFAVTVQLPAPVLTVGVNGTQVKLFWTKVANADSYMLYYAPAAASGSYDLTKLDQINVGTLNSLSFNLESGDHYFVAIQAVSHDYAGVSSFASNIEELKVP